MSVKVRTTLRQEQRALTRRRLLDAAATVFAGRGWAGASVEEIARQAGATTGALYSNFTGKEDLFLALFEERVAADIAQYEELSVAGETFDERVRGGADRWMQILRERPEYFPLVVEFWAYALREPGLRGRFAQRFAALRTAMARIVSEGAARQGVSLDGELAARLGTMIAALGNGLALEKLIDPDAVSDELFGDLLVVIFHGLGALSGERSTGS